MSHAVLYPLKAELPVLLYISTGCGFLVISLPHDDRPAEWYNREQQNAKHEKNVLNILAYHNSYYMS